MPQERTGQATSTKHLICVNNPVQLLWVVQVFIVCVCVCVSADLLFQSLLEISGKKRYKVSLFDIIEE